MFLKWLLLVLCACYSYAAQTRIINGSAVDDASNRWYFTVSYRYDGAHTCGGTLIAPTWVLTAAHCWEDPRTDKDTVALGSYTLANQRDIAIKQAIVHPDYIGDDNDIALFELQEPITDITPVILDRASPLAANTPSWVAGWGVSTEGSQTSEPALMEVFVPLVDVNDCNRSYGGGVTDNMICAGYMEGGKDSCQGDSGGPLISRYHQQWIQTGIVSWGEGCAQARYPGVYTKVQNYIAWIEQHTGALPHPVETVTTEPPLNPAVVYYLLDSSGP